MDCRRSAKGERSWNFYRLFVLAWPGSQRWLAAPSSRQCGGNHRRRAVDGGSGIAPDPVPARILACVSHRLIHVLEGSPAELIWAERARIAYGLIAGADPARSWRTYRAAQRAPCGGARPECQPAKVLAFFEGLLQVMREAICYPGPGRACTRPGAHASVRGQL